MGKCEKAAAWLVWWAMCDRVGWWARKKAHGREASEKGNRRAGIKIACPFTTSSLQELASKLPECFTISSEIQLGHLI